MSRLGGDGRQGCRYVGSNGHANAPRVRTRVRGLRGVRLAITGQPVVQGWRNLRICPGSYHIRAERGPASAPGSNRAT